MNKAERVLRAASGGERFDNPGICKGSFMAIVAVNGNAKVTIMETPNFRNCEGKDFDIIEGVPLWIQNRNPVLVSGSILALDAI